MWWPQALKLWNAQSGELKVKHKDVWAIPKKNTEPYEEVKDMSKPGHVMRKAVKELRKVEAETKNRNEERKKKVRLAFKNIPLPAL